MKYTVKYKNENYTIDGSRRFSEQSPDFKILWAQLDKIQLEGCQTAQVDNASVIVYDMGGVIVSMNENEMEVIYGE
ncbi:hypothetical protein [Dysgonomonas sp. ZJ279]|uniref:hypothetical protein n=1 Tax=Dysgonomonas sp. ZJ279 TaxID=2709796 RepID=UPI0013EE26B0|nr:hypothetical protein [Dysgonomonas sp. ZJ279]